MKKIIIEGKKDLKGKIKVSGAKNSALALVPAAILAKDEVVIENVPNISDIDSLSEILVNLGAKVERGNSTLKVDTSSVNKLIISEDISKKLRASYYFMGALLGKYNKVEMYFPGGCSIGSRPIDLHLKGFEALGAKVKEDGNKYIITAKKLKGANIYLDFPSVGATINIMFAAVMAEGETVIENAAKEPEISNVATFLNNMGAEIRGAGTSEIIIRGAKDLKGCSTEVIPDRIEAGTYVVLSAMAGKNVEVENLIPSHIDSLLIKLYELGFDVKTKSNSVIVKKTSVERPVIVRTQVYPGFPTDLQQPITPLLMSIKGTSELEETIYENRFQHVPYLNDMGGKIKVKGQVIKITGPTSFKGTTVRATDLRAGACLVLAALFAKGTTVIEDAQHILRGYENIVEKLENIGASIKIEED